MRYFVECTHTYESALNTGIQRVVRNIVNESLLLEGIRERIFPVIFSGGEFRRIAGPLQLAAPPTAKTPKAAKLRRALWNPLKHYGRNVYNAGRAFLAALIPWYPWVRFLQAPKNQWGLSRLLLLPREIVSRRARPTPSHDTAIAPGHGDVLVLRDSSWHLDIWPAVRAAKAKGVRVVCVVYDLIPHTHPQFCDQHLVGIFNRWMQTAMEEADGFVCISRTTAEQVGQALPRIAPDRQRPFSTNFFWLGSELDGHTSSSSGLPVEVAEILRVGTPTYLYVSTIEPRKNHRYALDAFDALWASGARASLVIVGRVGWRCEALIQRIRNHPQLNRQLFMLNDADDTTLAALYDHANGLIFTSITEGFGLPLVEALQRGLPVFASDIPVFREIGAEGVAFVDLENPAVLKDALATHLAAGAPRLPQPISWLTWKASAEQFWQRLGNCLAGTA
jgi:alpha-1,2-rhamnosyltransferase